MVPFAQDFMLRALRSRFLKKFAVKTDGKCADECEKITNKNQMEDLK